MITIKSVFVLLCLVYLSETERIKIHAKKLIEGKVVAKGSSVVAKTLPQCIEYCNEREDSCDGIVFHEIIGKCRLISKCAPAFQMDNSSHISYYSRRPQIKSYGYVHDPKTDTCIGLVVIRVDYPTAEATCSQQNADVAVLSEKYLNDIGRNLVSNSTANWAWIKENNIAHPERSKPHGISGNNVLSEEVFSPEVVQWRNGSGHSCWALNKSGQWGQFPCKNVTMFVLCQVSRYPV